MLSFLIEFRRHCSAAVAELHYQNLSLLMTCRGPVHLACQYPCYPLVFTRASYFLMLNPQHTEPRDFT